MLRHIIDINAQIKKPSLHENTQIITAYPI